MYIFPNFQTIISLKSHLLVKRIPLYVLQTAVCLRFHKKPLNVNGLGVSPEDADRLRPRNVVKIYFP